MTIWAIVPVKPLRRGKSRLAGVLNEDERAALNQELLERTLKTLSSLKELIQTMVVSRDPQALAIARNYDALTLREDGRPELNTALKRAMMVLQMDASGALILPADLPFMEREDVIALLERAVDHSPAVVISPDRRRNGTNALLTIPPGVIQYGYGKGSFERHCERAREVGAHLEIVELPSLALDLDLPEDLELVRKLEAEKNLAPLRAI